MAPGIEAPSEAKKGSGCAIWAVAAAVIMIGIIASQTAKPTAAPPAVTPRPPPAPISAPASNAAAADSLPTYSTPSAKSVRRAAAEAQRVFAAEGLSGLSHYGGQCFDALSHGGTFAGLDFCLAFDTFAVRMASGAPDYVSAQGTYFTTADQRGIAAATPILGDQGDPAARLADIRRMASELSVPPPAEAATSGAEVETEATAKEAPAT